MQNLERNEDIFKKISHLVAYETAQDEEQFVYKLSIVHLFLNVMMTVSVKSKKNYKILQRLSDTYFAFMTLGRQH